MSLPESLTAAVKGVYDGLDVRLQSVSYEWQCAGMRVSGKFFYITFIDGVPSVPAFAKYIYHRIIPYCLTRATRAEKDAKYRQTNDARYIHELTDSAKDLFIKARKSLKTSGEPGEVILFVLLEAILKAPQIVCKMSLKTSEKMPVHGSDSIHVTQGDNQHALKLVWGESKLYSDLSKSLDEVCNSLQDFLKDDSGRSCRDRDLEIIRDHMDVPEDLKESLLKYFDPYETESNLREEAFACFVGFDYAIYSSLDGYAPSERDARFQEHFKERISSACELFCNKLKSSGLGNLTIYFFLIPFPSVADFRTKFFNHLGISP